MPDLVPLAPLRVTRLVAQANPREFTLFLGAGASKSSGILLAFEMIREWRQTAFEENNPAPADFDAWCQQQPWFKRDDEYSVLFELLYPTQRARQAYIENKVEGAFPSWGYLYLANIVHHGYFNTIFTTNFDDLINDALTMYLGYNPVVCAADSAVLDVRITTDRAKIIKLHGDYLFQRLKNTVAELDQLDPNMSDKLREFAQECGMVVIGYAGRDHSVMRVFEELVKDARAFPNGIYWSVRPRDEPAPRVKAMATQFPQRFHLFECPDFDTFMAGLNAELKLALPRAILLPYQDVQARFDRLVKMATANQLNDPTIKEHIAQLRDKLNLDVAKATDVAELDLLQAQLALGRRDYQTALEYVVRYDRQRPNDATALTTWGDALAVQAEEEAAEFAATEAATKWQQAIQRNPHALPPRYSLARYYSRKQKNAEALQVCEELARLAPKDEALQRNLVTLYATVGRFDDALQQLDALIARDPGAADHHAMRAAVLEQKGLMPESLREIQRAVALNPGNAALRFMLGNSLARLAKWDDAAAEYTQATTLDPKNLSYRLQIASFLWTLQKSALAVPHLQQAILIEPHSAEAHGALGQCYAAVGNWQAAQDATATALQLSPQDSRLHVNAGILYAAANRLDLSEQHLQTALELNPAIPQPYYMLCWLYWNQQRGQEFTAAFQKLQQLAPQVAQQLQMQLQAARVQPMNWQAAWQQQLAGWLQGQTQTAQSAGWTRTQAGQAENIFAEWDKRLRGQ